MNLLSAIAEAAKLIGKVPADIRRPVLDALIEIVGGTNAEEAATKARYATIAVLAKRLYHRDDD